MTRPYVFGRPPSTENRPYSKLTQPPSEASNFHRYEWDGTCILWCRFRKLPRSSQQDLMTLTAAHKEYILYVFIAYFICLPPLPHVSASLPRSNATLLLGICTSAAVIKAHVSVAHEVALSCYCQDGHQLVTCSDDKSAKVWAVQRQRFKYSFVGHQNWVRAARFSPDAQMVLTGVLWIGRWRNFK